jgi:uncharacterized protein (DUF2336 family)
MYAWAGDIKYAGGLRHNQTETLPDVAVARPILVNSPLLSESDIIQLAEVADVEHLECMLHRRALTANSAKALQKRLQTVNAGALLDLHGDTATKGYLDAEVAPRRPPSYPK